MLSLIILKPFEITKGSKSAGFWKNEANEPDKVVYEAKLGKQKTGKKNRFPVDDKLEISLKLHQIVQNFEYARWTSRLFVLYPRLREKVRGLRSGTSQVSKTGK